MEKVILITPKRHRDKRGFFCETYNKATFLELGIDTDFVQDNHSKSIEKGTLRGMHYQVPPYAQSKLVSCIRGSIFDVVLDIRRHSSNYGRAEAYELTAENGLQLYVPVGFAHGFVTLEPDTEVVYKTSNFYAPEHEGSLHWNSMGIEWPVFGDPIISVKDAAAPNFSEFTSPFK